MHNFRQRRERDREETFSIPYKWQMDDRTMNILSITVFLREKEKKDPFKTKKFKEKLIWCHRERVERESLQR